MKSHWTVPTSQMSPMLLPMQWGCKTGEVLVVDVRPRHITFDILARDIPQENILGKETAILNAIRAVPGVTLYPETYLHSNGILGQILRRCGE